jgi:hypothetical protein
MGLFLGYLAYRHGKKKGERRARAAERFDDDSELECDECGYVESQHDEDGRCPSYEVFMVFPVMAVITVGILFAFMLGGGA